VARGPLASSSNKKSMLHTRWAASGAPAAGPAVQAASCALRRGLRLAFSGLTRDRTVDALDVDGPAVEAKTFVQHSVAVAAVLPASSLRRSRSFSASHCRRRAECWRPCPPAPRLAVRLSQVPAAGPAPRDIGDLLLTSAAHTTTTAVGTARSFLASQPAHSYGNVQAIPN